LSEEQYPDPATEAIGRIAQAALPAATLADVAARLAAARREEQDTGNRRRLAELHRQAAAEHAAAAAVYGPALNTTWLAAASLADLGAAWQAGHANTSRDPRAAEAAARVEQRLRRLHPPAMRHYDRRRGEGLTPAAAMAEAARVMAFVDPTAHTGPPGTRPALHATASPQAAAGHAAAAAYTPGLNPRWLQHASIFELGQVWQAAHRHAAADTRAAAAADQVEAQLRRLHPPAMRRYDELRAAGQPPAAAMAQAAVYLAHVDPTARPGQPSPAHPRLPTPEHRDGRKPGSELALPDPPAQPRTAGTASVPSHRAAPPGAEPAAPGTARDSAPAAAAAAGSHDTAAAQPGEHSPADQPVPAAPAVRADTGRAGPAAAAALRAQMFPQPLRTELAAASRLAPTSAPRPARPPTPSPGPSAAPPATGGPRR